MVLLSVRCIGKHCWMHGIENKRKVRSVKRTSWKIEFMGIGAASLKFFFIRERLKN